MMQIKRLHCPECGSTMRVNGSREIVPRMRTAYAQCENVMCSAAFKLEIELSKMVSQSSDLFATNTKPAPMPEDVSDLAMDMAYEFVVRSKRGWSRDETLAYCADYLCNKLDSISHARACMIAARAVADHESRYLNNWRISIDDSTSTALIVNRHPTAEEQLNGRGHEQKIISLRELVEFIEAREQAEKDGFLL